MTMFSNTVLAAKMMFENIERNDCMEDYDVEPLINPKNGS